MISIEQRAVLLLAVLGLGAGTATTAAAAGPLVVRADGPSAAAFKPGQRLPDAQPLVLRAGDRVTVLDGRGTRSLSGPGSFRFDQPATAAAAPSLFRELLTQKTERRARIGAVRGTAGDAPATPPGVWALDAGTSATVCTLDPAQVSLWRADAARPATLTVTASDGRSATVRFAAAQGTTPWPPALLATAGDQYRITGGARPVMLTVKRIGPSASIDALGEALLAQGCGGQFERLARATATTG